VHVVHQTTFRAALAWYIVLSARSSICELVSPGSGEAIPMLFSQMTANSSPPRRPTVSSVRR
jgi:hypothetical protein